jgi:tetratricopeptide (TPR) repeat protein
MAHAGGRVLWRVLLFLLLSVAYALGQSGDTSAVERYSEVGQRALAAGKYDEAEQAFEKLRELEPGMAEVHAQLGVIYFQERKFDQAVPALRQALKLKPGLPRTDTLLAISLSEMGRYNEALPGLEKGFHHSTDPAIQRMCGLQLERAYTGLQRDALAVQVALELDRLYPTDPEVLYHDGKIYGNFAFLTMHRLAQVAPDSIWRHQAEAEAYESQGTYDAAISEYRQVLSGDPRRPGIHYRLGRTLLARSRQTNAVEDVTAALHEFEQELQSEPSNANAAYEIAEIHRDAEEFDEAQQFFEVALKYYPDFEEAHLGLAATLMSLQKPEPALPHLQKAISLKSQDEVSWYRLSQVYGVLGQAEEQKKAFAEFQRLHSQKSAQQEAGKRIFSPSEVTQQQLDPKAAQ